MIEIVMYSWSSLLVLVSWGYSGSWSVWYVLIKLRWSEVLVSVAVSVSKLIVCIVKIVSVKNLWLINLFSYRILLPISNSLIDIYRLMLMQHIIYWSMKFLLNLMIQWLRCYDVFNNIVWLVINYLFLMLMCCRRRIWVRMLL